MARLYGEVAPTTDVRGVMIFRPNGLLGTRETLAMRSLVRAMLRRFRPPRPAVPVVASKES